MRPVGVDARPGGWASVWTLTRTSALVVVPSLFFRRTRVTAGASSLVMVGWDMSSQHAPVRECSSRVESAA